MVTGIKKATSTMFINNPFKINYINGELFFWGTRLIYGMLFANKTYRDVKKVSEPLYF